MKKFIVSGLVMGAGLMINSAAWANNVHGPWIPAACPSQGHPVSPETTKQATVTTAGLISDRIASSVAGYNSGTISSPTPTGASTANIRFEQTSPCGSWGPDRSLTDADHPPVMEKRPTDNGVWVAGANSWVQKSDLNAKFHGQVIDTVMGYDRKLNADTVVGVAVGYEHYDFLTSFNNGTVKGQSLSISPYIGYSITDWLSFDATAGHGWVGYDYTRNSDAINGNNSASRWFGSTDLNATKHYGTAVVRASVGYLKVYEDQSSFTESDGTTNAKSQVNLGEARATIGGAYDIRQDWGTLSPTAFARYEYDLNAPHSVNVATNGTTTAGRMGATFGLGANAQLNNGWKLGFTGSTEEFRRNTSIYTLLGNARYDF